jgi:hypothetical protein
MNRTTSLVVVGLLFASTPAAGQTADVAREPLKGTPNVIVTDRAGQETTGRLISWTGSTIVIRSTSGERTYAPGEALRLDLRHDSLKNGFLIGAAIGWLGAVLVDCPEGSCAGMRIAAAIGGTAIYGALGAGIDALIPGRTPLWSSGTSEKRSAGLTFNLSPRERRAFIGWRFRP